MTLSALRAAVDARVPYAGRLFDEIGDRSRVDGAILRDPFGPGEQLAFDRIAEEAAALGLARESDFAGNLYLTWRGAEGRPACLVGSHVDAVPRGGNYDGLAGVLAGLVAIAAMKDAGLAPARDVTLMVVRAEESAWFAAQHVGSRAALGTLDPALLDSARRVDSGRTLGEHMAAAGLDLAPIRSRERVLAPERVRCFLELHIEQGPVLETRGIPAAIVTGIRGNVRCSDCHCLGAYGHSGTVPRALRRDAAFAVAELMAGLDAVWGEWDAAGRDLVLTFGQLGTDPAVHATTTIPGEVRFSIDARSHDDAVLRDLRVEIAGRADAIAERRNVSFRFGPFTESSAVTMDARLRRRLAEAAAALGLDVPELASGAGHDAQDFALAGIPSAMVFVRNANGSHNPNEAMRMEDFGPATALLAAALAAESGAL